MRAVEFRAWDIDKQKYITWFEIGCEGCVTTQEPNCSPDYPNVILEQYTGLKDKNGKKIYEGDIVKLTGKVAKNKSTLYKVVWDNFLTGFDLTSLERSKEDIGYLSEVEMEKRYKVIGNIHENEDLL